VHELEAGRALALATELATGGADLRDLDDELAVGRHHYVAVAVTEIAIRARSAVRCEHRR
jgi:hypothetical protein